MKPIKDYEGLYSITSDGRVYSHGRFVQGDKDWREGRYLNPEVSNRGYYRVDLRINQKHDRRTVHRLVCEYFLDNPYNKPQVNHKDGDKTNNDVSNLEWCTQLENNIHAHATGLNKGPQGEKQGGSKLKDQHVRIIMRSSIMQKKLAEIFNVSISTINGIKKGHHWTHIEA